MTRIIGGGDQGEPFSGTANRYSGAAVGHLIKKDDTGNYKFAQCADGDVPIGRVKALGPATDVMSYDLFTQNTVFHLPYTGAVSVGNDIKASATAGSVKAGGGTGSGRVIAVDLPTGFVDVEFKSKN